MNDPSFNNAFAKLASDVYADVASPAAKQLGMALETTFKVGLAPVRMLDWGYEQSKEWLANKVRERIQHIPPEHQVSPPFAIASAAIAGIAAHPDEESMRDLFAEMLLKAMDDRSALQVHPAFIKVLSEMSAREALVFISLRDVSEKKFERRQGDSVFMQVSRPEVGHPDRTLEMQFADHCLEIGIQAEYGVAQVWLDNLLRLGLLRIDSHPDMYLVPQEKERVNMRINNAEHRYLIITDFGETFLKSCRPPAT